ncbi:cytochrome C [Pseudalgibacter alginicilyticus]|uniref:Cytochrome C n=1 Tax=Pseudalgibacter alginicilyticus TaxID=1736674 RepID=A0A0P0CJ83_9FLAO|nr:cytochrome c [Pseudalgibacter alginicilyticus]ALJ06279.1 cytochrome C [Pseudalgibacter alginicilyticus]
MKLIIITYFTAITFVFCQNKQNPKLQESIERGRAIYTDFCVNCHMPAGEGVPETFPPLAKSDYLMKNREASIRGIKYGQSGEIVVNGKTYNGTMAPMGLSDDEVADVMNYITNSWGNKNDKMVTEVEVSNIKK